MRQRTDEGLLMGGKKWAHLTQADPEPVVALLAQRPACFGAFDWRQYLRDVYVSQYDDRLNRDRVRSGQVPNFCLQCTSGHQAKQQALGRCHPPYPAKTIPIVQAAQSAGTGAAA